MLTRNATIYLIAVTAAVMSVLCPARVRARSQDSLTAPATDNEIAALIRDLGDPSYEKRTYATRRLCAIGMRARRSIVTAARGDDAETAMRAEAVLAVLERLMFSGVEIRLSFPETKIAWDEPLDLRITMTNRTKYQARVPFEIDRGAASATSSDPQQVARMLDIAELLQVRGSDGKEIHLTVDDIAADPQVVDAVGRRLNGAPSALLGPGETVTILGRAFNRGWARYPMLDAGRYTILMEYVPSWDDDVLAAQRVGRVVSNQVHLTVTSAAPETVSRHGVEASLSVEQDGRFVAAILTNRSDLPVTVNRNFGRALPFADGRWVCESGDLRREMRLVPDPGASWHDFDPALLSQVKAGKSIELARISIGELRGALADARATIDDGRWTVHFSYMNLCNRRWQVRQGSALLGNPKAPAVFQGTLPRRILSTKHISNRLTAPGAN